MCVYDVCEEKVTGRVFGFVCNAKIEVPNPHRELLLDASVLREEQLIKHEPTYLYQNYPMRHDSMCMK